MNIGNKNSRSFSVNQDFYELVNTEILPFTSVEEEKFWEEFTCLVEEFGVRTDQPSPQNGSGYSAKIAQGEVVSNVDDEVSLLAGPHLHAQLTNARSALDAANARWGSLYEALYNAEDLIPKCSGLKTGNNYNAARGARVVCYAKDFLDQTFPLSEGSHHYVKSYLVYFQNLMVIMADGSTTGLQNPAQFVAKCGPKSDPESILLKNNGLHVEIMLNRNSSSGTSDLAGVEDIQIEAALTTIVDCDNQGSGTLDKCGVYRNWLGMIRGNLESHSGSADKCRLADDRVFSGRDGEEYQLSGRGVLIVRHVEHEGDIDVVINQDGLKVSEGFLDTVMTALIGSLDVLESSKSSRCNSRKGSIYMLKPKAHGEHEVQATCELLTRLEGLLGLESNTLKLALDEQSDIAGARMVSLNRTAQAPQTCERVNNNEQSSLPAWSSLASAAVIQALSFHQPRSIAAVLH